MKSCIGRSLGWEDFPSRLVIEAYIETLMSCPAVDFDKRMPGTLKCPPGEILQKFVKLFFCSIPAKGSLAVQSATQGIN